MPIVAIAVFVALALSQGHIDPFDRVLGPGYALVNAGGAWGIVVDERFAARFAPSTDAQSVETWTPGAIDIAHAELLLRPYGPADSGLDDPPGHVAPGDLVSRTWYGAVIDGRRLLFVDGYCSGGIPANPLTPMLIADGGPCYWSATIDADTWVVMSYVENGEA